MVTLTNLRLPLSWATALPQDNNFDISRDQLDDFLEAIGDVDWGTTNFTNLGTINGIAISAFWTDSSNGVIGLLADVDPLVSSAPVEGDILFYDNTNWNRLPRGTDGQFLKSTLTGIAWGTGIAQINDFSDADFSIFNAGDATKIAQVDASGISPGTTRTYAFPDKDGTFAMLSDIVAAVNEFDDSLFRIFDNVDNTKKVAFQTSGITTATTRTVTLPDKDGTLAMLSDITAPGNTFADDLFRVFDNVDNTKLLAFILDGFTTATTRSWTWQDADDVVVGRDTTDIFTNKSIDLANNTLTTTKAQLDTAVSDGDIAFLNQANTFLAGFTQSVEHDATNPGLRIIPAAGDPSVLLDGHVWYNQTSNQLFGRINGANVDLGSVTPQDSAFVITCTGELDDLVVDLVSPTTTFRMTFPFTLNTGTGLNLGVRASVRDMPVGSDIIVDIEQNGTSILSAPIHIDDGDTESVSSATQATILTSALTDNALIEVFVTQVGSTTPGKGLKVYLIGMS